MNDDRASPQHKGFIMKNLQSILFATDFRPASRDAAEVAGRLAASFGSHVTLLHVLDPLPHDRPSLMHLNREHATAQLRELAEFLASKRVVLDETATAVGHAADVITRKADEIGADLILIGAGERSRLDHFAHGPNAAAIMQHATKPVLAVRPGEPPAAFRKILCPVDMSAASMRGLLNAIRLARAFGSHLLVLTVVPSPNWFELVVEAKSLAEIKVEHDREWRASFEQFLLTAPLGNVSWAKEIRSGAPQREIIAAAAAHQSDLIVMGSTGRTGLARVLMGSVTRRVIQQLPCSLLTVKPEELPEEEFSSDVNTIRILYAEGRELLRAKSYEAAAAKFNQVLGHDPYHALALKGRADAFDQLGHAHDAARSRRRASVIEECEYELGGGD
jgi:nucleotide-binding universal stress UspA family protein